MRLLLILSVVLLAACEMEPMQLGDSVLEPVVPRCDVAAADFYDDKVWPVLSKNCATCHGPNGMADGQGAKFVFALNASQSFGNVDAYIKSHGAMLVNKPTLNGVSHGGGRVLGGQSDQAAVLTEAVLRFGSANVCEQTPTEPALEVGFDDINNINAQRTARKAAIVLQGRMPTLAEVNSAATSDEQLRTILRNYLQGEVFDEWLMNSANDHLLTRKYFTGQTDAQEALNAMTWNYPDLNKRTSAAFEAADDLRNQCSAAGGYAAADSPIKACSDLYEAQQFAGTVYRETQRALAEEPLQLIRYVVSQNKPYSEILTANYMMMNPFTYEILDGDTWKTAHNSMDANDWRPGHIRKYRFNWNNYMPAGQYVPSAGVLSSPVFLARYPSTETNRNRARARWAYYFFLGTDIERLSARAMDPDELQNVTKPGDAGTSCFGCHQLMDPVAGAFQSFGNEGQYLVRRGNDSLPQLYVNSPAFKTGEQWYNEQLHPGFNGVNLPTDMPFGKSTTHADGLQWLAEQMVADDRFAKGTAMFWFNGVFGRDPLLMPLAQDDADYAAKLAAFEAEQALIAEWATRFKASNYDLKSLLVDMMMSPLFRGETIDSNDPLRLAALKELGIGRLLTPEQLDRKLTASTGFVWQLDWQREPQLRQNYYMFYGGIDSDGITERANTLNSLMVSVVERMANEVACEIVAQEFWPGMPRTLFTGVAISTDPRTSAGEAAIKNTIENLMWRLWGVQDATERDALWQLYKALYDQRMAWRVNNSEFVSDFLSYTALYDNDRTDSAQDETCRFRDYDPNDGINIQLNWNSVNWSGTPEQIRQHLGSNYNPEQTLRPWVGVLQAMLSDIQFVTE